MFRIFSKEEIDLTKIVFDPKNDNHTAMLNEYVNSFLGLTNKLYNVDIIIAFPVSAVLLLWLSGCCGIIIEAVLLIGCAAVLKASGQMKNRNDLYSQFQFELNRLVDIYQLYIQSNGYKQTNDSSVVTLMETIAPYVETSTLWCADSKNSYDCSDEIKKVLSTAPHRVPFSHVSNQNEVNNTSILMGLFQSVQKNSLAEQNKSVNTSAYQSVKRLYIQSKADINQAVYGLKKSP